MEGVVATIENREIEITPEKWTPARGRLRVGWPLIVFREENPNSGPGGSETELISGAHIERSEGGSLQAIAEKKRHSRVKLEDKVISR